MAFDAIVVGAGVAGLSAATRLAEAGVRVLVIEARPVLGGRATAFTDPATGERVDNGQHVLFGCYDETFRLLRRVGTEGDVELQPTLAVTVIERSGRTTRLSCPKLPSPFHLLGGVMTWRALSMADRIAVVRMAGPLRAASAMNAQAAVAGAPIQAGRSALPRDDETVRQWLVRIGQTPRLIELLWEPLAVAALNESVDVAAAWPFARVLAKLFGSTARGASLGLPRKPLDELYALPAKRFVESRGGQVVCGVKARVSSRDETTIVVGPSGDNWVADAVIVAVPWHDLSAVFEITPPSLAGVVERAATVRASSIVTVNLWLNQPLGLGSFVGLPGRTFQWLFDKHALFGESSSHLSMVSSGADSVIGRRNDEIVELASSELRSAVPRLGSNGIRRAVVVRERNATFSVAPGGPSRPSCMTDVPGLYLAGDWIETMLPATIEGAALSGHRAAEAALARIGRTAS